MEAAAEKASEEKSDATGVTEEEGMDPERETGSKMGATGLGRETKKPEETVTVKTELKNWDKVVALVRPNFGEGRLDEEAMWQAVVLIPKGGGEYRGIYLMEVVWKVGAVILNIQLIASITFHNVLHGFWGGRGKGTATLEAKLLQ